MTSRLISKSSFCVTLVYCWMCSDVSFVYLSQSQARLRSVVRRVFQTSTRPRRWKWCLWTQGEKKQSVTMDLQVLVLTDICDTFGFYSQGEVRMWSNISFHPWQVRCLLLCLQGDQIGIAPQMFKALVGRGHPEFSTNRQQDAQEFLLHFINMVEVK